MPKGIHPRPMKLRDLLSRLKHYGIVAMGSERGKGSEIILIKPITPGEMRGPQYPIKNHGLGTEISKAVIITALRRFGITEEEFWRDAS